MANAVSRAKRETAAVAAPPSLNASANRGSDRRQWCGRMQMGHEANSLVRPFVMTFQFLSATRLQCYPSCPSFPIRPSLEANDFPLRLLRSRRRRKIAKRASPLSIIVCCCVGKTKEMAARTNVEIGVFLSLSLAVINSMAVGSLSTKRGEGGERAAAQTVVARTSVGRNSLVYTARLGGDGGRCARSSTK